MAHDNFRSHSARSARPLFTIKIGGKMVTGYTEKNAETGRRGGAGLIDENLNENKISASIIDAA